MMCSEMSIRYTASGPFPDVIVTWSSQPSVRAGLAEEFGAEITGRVGR